MFLRGTTQRRGHLAEKAVGYRAVLLPGDTFCTDAWAQEHSLFLVKPVVLARNKWKKNSVRPYMKLSDALRVLWPLCSICGSLSIYLSKIWTPYVKFVKYKIVCINFCMYLMLSEQCRYIPPPPTRPGLSVISFNRRSVLLNDAETTLRWHSHWELPACGKTPFGHSSKTAATRLCYFKNRSIRLWKNVLHGIKLMIACKYSKNTDIVTSCLFVRLSIVEGRRVCVKVPRSMLVTQDKLSCCTRA